jgi:hypothetical protein
MKDLVALGVMVVVIGCSTSKRDASSLGIRCNDGERLEPGTPLVEAFALKNFGDRSRIQGTTAAVSIELVDRPTKLVRTQLLDGTMLQVKIVNRIDQPVWLAARRYGDVGFAWIGKGILEWFRDYDFRPSCEEFSVIPVQGAEIVPVPLGGRHVHLVGSVLTLRLVYFMMPALVPLPPRGVVPVIGHAESESIEIEIEPG